MPRRNKNVEFRSLPVDDRRLNQGNVLRVVRMVDLDDSAKITGALREMEIDGSTPPYKNMPLVHPVYVLDPRLVNKTFNYGFHFGFDVARRRVEARHGSELADDRLRVAIGGLAIKGIQDGVKNRLFARIESEEVLIERRAYYEALAEAGGKGLPIQEGQTIPMPELYLGRFNIPKLPKDQRDLEHESSERKEIIDAIESSFIIHGLDEITLGPSVTRIPE